MAEQKIVRMTNDAFVNMISESVMRTLQEGAAGSFLKGLGQVAAKGGKYAWNRMINNQPAHDINKGYDKNQDLKAKLDDHMKTHDSLSRDDYNKLSGNNATSSNTSESNN